MSRVVDALGKTKPYKKNLEKKKNQRLNVIMQPSYYGVYPLCRFSIYCLSGIPLKASELDSW